MKQTIQQRAEIMDDIYFRMYANDGWNGPENIKLALPGAFLSTNIEPANNSYNINKRETYLSGFRFKV